MLKPFTLLIVFVQMAIAATPLIREVTSDATGASGTPPSFFKGYMYWAGRELFRIYTPDGHQAPPVSPSRGTAEAIAVDTDGTLAIAWNTPAAGGIDIRDSSGALVRTIQTGPYWPTQLAFAEDHCLWSLGWKIIGRPLNLGRDDYMIVRKFLPNGEQAGAFLPRSLFPDGLEPGGPDVRPSNCIVFSHDRVGLLVMSGMDSGKTEWLELDLNGNLTGRWRTDSFTNDRRVALTSDNHVFVYHRSQNGRTPYLLTLDRNTSTWQPVPSPPSGYLAGADGDALIFADYTAGPIQLRWYQHP